MSLASSVITRIIKSFNNRKVFEDDKMFEEYLNKKRISNSKPFQLRYPFSNLIVVEKQKINDMRYFVFNRKYSKHTIFYYHGGSYIDKPNMFHFKFIEKLLLKKKVCVVFPIYPRLPDNTSSVAYEKLNQLFDDFIQKNKVEKITSMGDSAGGGLALSMASITAERYDYVKENKQNVVLLSPWLDVATDNPEIDLIQPFDFQLSKIGLSKLGNMWAEGNPKASPASAMFSSLNCGKISLFTGTREILYVDNVKFKIMAENEGVIINFKEYSNMSHCFMLMPIPEAEKAFQDIIKCI